MIVSEATLTATLIPLPTSAPTFTGLNRELSLYSVEHLPGSPDLPKQNPRDFRLIGLLVLCPLAFLLVLWITLAGWFVFTQRPIK